MSRDGELSHCRAAGESGRSGSELHVLLKSRLFIEEQSADDNLVMHCTCATNFPLPHYGTEAELDVFRTRTTVGTAPATVDRFIGGDGCEVHKDACSHHGTNPLEKVTSSHCCFLSFISMDSVLS